MTSVKPHPAQFPQRGFSGTIIGLCFNAPPVCLKYSWDVDELIMLLYRRASSSLTRAYRERVFFYTKHWHAALWSSTFSRYLIIFNDGRLRQLNGCKIYFWQVQPNIQQHSRQSKQSPSFDPAHSLCNPVQGWLKESSRIAQLLISVVNTAQHHAGPKVRRLLGRIIINHIIFDESYTSRYGGRGTAFNFPNLSLSGIGSISLG